MAITIVDTETTDLVMAEGSDIALQPQIIEIYALQVDKDFNFIREIDTLVRPTRPIPTFITKLTGINDQMVANAPTFAEVYRKLVGVFLGSHTMVAHNLPFDLDMMILELRRIGKEKAFPYPPIQFCTVEQSMHLKGHRLKNSELLELAGGGDIDGAHRAKADVLGTFTSYKWLNRNKQ